MLKKLIAPLQESLIQRKMCAGCMRYLDEQHDRKTKINQTEQVTCECGRIYIYDRRFDTYRRALESEVK
jgi:hypothetical protein